VSCLDLVGGAHWQVIGEFCVTKVPQRGYKLLNAVEHPGVNLAPLRPQPLEAFLTDIALPKFGLMLLHCTQVLNGPAAQPMG
jgi:hypothetical protein